MQAMDVRVMVGERIRNARKRAKLNQREMALSVGLSPNGLAKIERGESDPKLTTLFRIANSLFIEVADLVSLIPMFPLQSGSLEANEQGRTYARELQSKLKVRMDEQLATGLSVDDVLKKWMPGSVK